MDLASVRSLKQELAAIATPEETLSPPIALGITKSGRDYRLAIRVLESRAGVASAVQKLVEQARGEAQVKLVGLIAKQAPWRRRRNRPLLIGSSVGHRPCCRPSSIYPVEAQRQKQG